MQCYSEVVPPTAVSHSVSLPFLHPKANNLVVAKTSLLQVFEIKSISTEVSSNGVENGDSLGQDHADDVVDLELHRMEDTAKLSLLCEYHLAGTVTALKRVKILNTKSGGEALLVAFRDAKLSLVEWDPESYKISTISVHYYEGEGLQSCPWSPDLATCQNFLTVDPCSRCAALKFGQRQLAILPFRQLVDDFAEDYDPEFDEPVEKPKTNFEKKDGEASAVSETPYKSSFVLSLTALDPSLTHPVHLAFLHGFRDPTFGILYSSRSASLALLNERRDILSYTVFNLDLEQRASTSILSVNGLPNDLFEVIALPSPVGGALLVGNNELVHIDQDGKVNALAVNEFARVVSKFAMVDGSNLSLRLEHCTVQQIGETGDLLMILNSGDLAIVSFDLEGRSVSGIQVHKVSSDRGGSLLPAGVTCASPLSRSRMFLGSQDSDAVVMGWSSVQKQPTLTRKRSHAEMLGEDQDMDIDDAYVDDEDEDDIYGADDSAKQHRRGSIQGNVNPADLTFRIHDKLPNYAPIGPMTLGLPPKYSKTMRKPASYVEMVYPCGRSSAGGLAILNREIDAVVLSKPDLPRTKSFWAVRPLYDLTASAEFHEYVVAVQTSEDGDDRSVLYKITPSGLEKCEKDEFEPEAGATVEMGTLAGGKKILQVLRDQVKVYDENFNLEQIIPASGEAIDVELEFIGASFCDPYVSLLRNDSSITVLQSTSTELEELERKDAILAAEWLSASVYRPPGSDKPLLFALTSECALRIFELPDLSTAACSFEGFGFLPPTLSSDFVQRRTAGKEALTEIIVADIGDEISKSTYLVARTKNDDLVLYAPFKHPHDSQMQTSFTSHLRWRKVLQPNLAKYTEEPDTEKATSERETMLRRLENVGGYSTVFQTGASPCFVLKEASSSPRVVPFREKAVKSLSRFHTADCDHGFAYVDADGTIRISQLPSSCRYGDTGWVTRKIELREEIQRISYFAPKQLYCVASTEKVMFKLPEDDYHYEWAKEDTAFLPTVDQAAIKLYYPNNWSVIDMYQLEPAEVVLAMRIIDLEVSEHTHARKSLLCVGTAIIHGEDLATKGNVYIFEINTVVPEPERPETGSKFKLIVKEEVRGAVTAITEIGDEGFLLHAQGQKAMVRGLKEDNTLLPVAFMDMQTYVTVAKSLKGTGMALMGDILKGLWFVGYTQEPYRITLFGKSKQRIEVVDADFLPFEKHLYFIVADGDENIQVLEYDNEDPRSLGGQRLVNKAAFHTGHFPVSLHLLPSSLRTESQQSISNGDMNGRTEPTSRLNQVLLLTQTGAVALISPIDEQTYRRLGALHTYLVNQIDLACGLNPRAYRAVEGALRGLIDGSLLRRWTELPSSRQQEACAKIGVEEWVLRNDLETIGGAGLGYL
ncbi:uncharacterized protein PV09_01463 [Verruconis gallopava]|uniref:Cleavage/polyadenylation specificity factor A subunit C-terminal domain-containing protein n=1 Tax=Verruconis gallopava TaxID=253628 RepID=A0A0D2AL79_9PEZI|nr:uncharacterized protein PV09_01463 [Verruconis gallopava]KIW07498.1 hypothetical protein PV09_01463 [Verruconis gallopava]